MWRTSGWRTSRPKRVSRAWAGSGGSVRPASIHACAAPGRRRAAAAAVPRPPGAWCRTVGAAPAEAPARRTRRLTRVPSAARVFAVAARTARQAGQQPRERQERDAKPCPSPVPDRLGGAITLPRHPAGSAAAPRVTPLPHARRHRSSRSRWPLMPRYRARDGMAEILALACSGGTPQPKGEDGAAMTL